MKIIKMDFLFNTNLDDYARVMFVIKVRRMITKKRYLEEFIMLTVEHYIGSIELNLETQSRTVVDQLQNIFSYRFSKNIEVLEFTAFIEPTRFELSITMFSMDKEGNEVFNEENDSTAFAGSEEVLQEFEYYQVIDSQSDAFYAFHEQNEETLLDQEQHVFAQWFRRCWEKAGGVSLDLPSYFTLHNSDDSLELKNNRWMDDEEKWS